MPTIAYDLNFWSGIMRDHAEFQLMNLSSRESQFAMTSQKFKNIFEQIYSETEKLIQNPNEQEIEIMRKVCPILIEYINYKKLLLKKLLECDIELNLPPTFVNHMINEAMEFYRTLNMLQSNVPIDKVSENILLHTIWLPDAAGHAASIASNLDPTEALLIKEAEEFKKTFNCLFIKASELEQMLPRVCINSHALEFLNEEVINEISKFICYLEKIKELREKCKAMGTLNPLIPDHMMREEKYYLSKIINLM